MPCLFVACMQLLYTAALSCVCTLMHHTRITGITESAICICVLDRSIQLNFTSVFR